MLTKMVFENGHFLGLGGPLSSTECSLILAHLINDVSFVHNHNLPIGYDLLQVIGEQFSPDVDSFDCGVNHFSLANRDDVGEGKARIHH